MSLVERSSPLRTHDERGKEERASMAWTHVRHRVEDYPKWKEVFDSTAEYKRSHGWKGYRIHAIEGDNNHLLIMEEFETEDQVRQFIGSDYLREAMGRAGVSDEPDIMVVELLEEGPPAGPVSGVTDTVGDTVGGATDSVRGVTDNLLGGEEKRR
jgi:uncharacterized protein (DUF1330 family)